MIGTTFAAKRSASAFTLATARWRTRSIPQSRSGLGLEAQRSAVLAYLNGGAWDLVAEFTETESGKRSDRPELAAALDTCRRLKARLVIAKLDRLSRNVAFIAALMDASVEFVAVDNPHRQPVDAAHSGRRRRA